jgi:predicted translin family RNA/ssDNA-binding protein
MPPDVLGGLVAVLGVVSVGILVLVGMRMRFVHKMQSGNKTDELEQVNDALDALHEQTRLLREDVSELQERMDFHERLLTQARPRVDTPV